MLEIELYGEAGEGGGSGGGEMGVDAADAGNQKIGCAEIEVGREPEGGGGGCGVDFAFAEGELADGVVGCAVGLGEEGGRARDGDVLGE